MKGVVQGALMATGGLSVFGVSVVGMLALSGRLNSEGVQDVPVLNKIIPKDDGPAPENETNAASVTEATAKKQKKQGDGERRLAGKKVKQRALFKFEGFDPPTTQNEINKLYKRAKERLRKVELDAAVVDRKELALETRERDLQERRKRVEQLMDEVLRKIEELKTGRAQLADDITTLKAQEVKNIKRQAQTLAGMEPQKASEYLLELGPDKEDLAVKLLASMEVEAASQLLGVMDSKRGARLIERGTRLLRK